MADTPKGTLPWRDVLESDVVSAALAWLEAMKSNNFGRLILAQVTLLDAATQLSDYRS